MRLLFTRDHDQPRLLETGRQEVGAEGLLLVAQREFASTSPHDNTVQVTQIQTFQKNPAK